MLSSIAYHVRPEFAKVRIDNIIQFPDSYCTGLGRVSYLDNGYDFLRQYLTILGIF